jgi:hypothetical protein
MLIVFFSQIIYPHEFWMVSHGKPQVGNSISISARVGETWPGEQVIRYPNMINALKVYYGFEKEGTPLSGRDNTHVFGHYKIKKPDTQTVVLETQSFQLMLSGKEFNQYLEEEGLDEALALRRKNNLLDTPTRELFSRISKSHVHIGKDNAYMRVFGLPLEITIKSNLQQRTKTELLITSNGRPVENQMIKAQLKEAHTKNLIARTNKQGVAVFDLSKTGVWRLSTVSIQPLNNGNIQWRSIWSSTTIELK